MKMSDKKSYVYNTTEVILTGRKATRKTTTRHGRQVTEILVEVKPADEEGPSWSAWVKPSELFEVFEG